MASNHLAHYGVKGMKWGRRKADGNSAVDVSTTAKPGQRVTAKGGTGQPASADAIRAATARQKAKASTTDALSNKELKDLVERWNLEQRYRDLATKDAMARRTTGQKFVDKLIKNPQQIDKDIQNLKKTGQDFATVGRFIGNMAANWKGSNQGSSQQRAYSYQVSNVLELE